MAHSQRRKVNAILTLVNLYRRWIKSTCSSENLGYNYLVPQTYWENAMTLVTLDQTASEQVDALAKALNMTTDEVLKLSVQRLTNEVFHPQVHDDGPLSEEYLRWFQEKASNEMNSPPTFTQFLIK